MPIQFLVNSQDADDKQMARSLVSREREIKSYMFELESHQRVIDANAELAWGENDVKYKGKGRDAIIAMALHDGLGEEDIQRLLKLQVVANHKHQVQAVKSELARAEGFYGEILERLPAGKRRDAALQAVLLEE